MNPVILTTIIINLTVTAVANLALRPVAERIEQNTVFRLVFGSPDAVVTLGIALVGFAASSAGTDWGGDVVMGALYGFLGDFLARPFMKRLRTPAKVEADEHETGKSNNI